MGDAFWMADWVRIFWIYKMFLWMRKVGPYSFVGIYFWGCLFFLKFGGFFEPFWRFFEV